MDLFEVLFILLFILFPILEQMRKKGKQGDKPPGKPGPGARTRTQGSQPGTPVGRGSTTAEGQPTSAEDMVPDDLWAILTGETRTRPKPQEPAQDEEPWSQVPETAPASEPQPASGRWDADIEREPWEDQSEMVVWDVTAPAEPERQPASLEYQGPEAYSLERVDYQPVSLERPIPSAEARHREFHELIERTRQVRQRRSNPVARALRDPDQLRNAIILAEVLGPPKGLSGD